MSEVYINKKDLMSSIHRDMLNNKHRTDEGRLVHEQEHDHLLKVINRMPAYKNIPIDDAVTIVANLFNDIENMMETNKYHDPEFGNWEETCVEIDIETLNELRTKYFDLLHSL